MSLAKFYKYMAIIALLCPWHAAAQSESNFEDAYQPLDTMYAVLQAVKFDPVQVFFGDYQFYYERKLAGQWSIEVGAGPTRRNFTASMWEYELDNFGNNVDIKTRYAASLWLRHYFWDTGELYGLYVAAAAMHRRHDKSFEVIANDGTRSGQIFDDSRRYTSLMAVVGYQAIPLQSNIFCDFYLALGARHRDLHIVRTTDFNNPEAYEVRHTASWAGAVQVGVKVGVGF